MMHDEYDEYDDMPGATGDAPPADPGADDEPRGPLDAVAIDDACDVENDEPVPMEPEDKVVYDLGLVDAKFQLSAKKKTPSVYVRWKILTGPSAGEFVDTTKWLPQPGDEDRMTPSGSETKRAWKRKQLARFYQGIGLPSSNFPMSEDPRRKGKRMGFAEAIGYWARAVKRAGPNAIVFTGKCSVEDNNGFVSYRVESPKVKTPKGWTVPTT